MRDPNEKVVLAYVRPQQVDGWFMESVVNLLLYDFALHRRIVDGGGGYVPQVAGANLSSPRNNVVKQFLAYGKAEWLWWVDTDMVFAPDTLERLLEHADPERAPIVGALCFGFDDKGEVQPTLYGLVGEVGNVQVVRYHEWEPNAMFQVPATGTGCLLVHHSAFERIRDAEFPDRPGQRGFNPAYPWFQETDHDGAPVGEDITFCWRAGLLDIPVYVNTAVQVGHIKERLLTMESYFLGRGLLAPTHQGAAV